MVKFERIETEKALAAIRSLNKAEENRSTYNTPEVNDALQEMFHGKCYICENKDATSYQIEHLTSHKGNYDLKYDWNNLFLVCAHCNNTKLSGYEPILDCTQERVDEVISFRREGYFGTDESWEFKALDDRTETLNTVRLLKDVYDGKTPQKQFEAKRLRRILRKELSEFKEKVRQYKESEGEDKIDLEMAIKRELKNSSAFTAFKRWLIKDNIDYYSELEKYIRMH